jgi:hypothetical protein
LAFGFALGFVLGFVFGYAVLYGYFGLYKDVWATDKAIQIVLGDGQGYTNIFV